MRIRLFSTPRQTASCWRLPSRSTRLRSSTSTRYPRYDIDVDDEQQRLAEHDAIVFQFPLYWYSTPPILKEWQDLVLEHGFAYGETGAALKGKPWLCAATAGASHGAYAFDGYQRAAHCDLYWLHWRRRRTSARCLFLPLTSCLARSIPTTPRGRSTYLATQGYSRHCVTISWTLMRCGGRIC
ncbi:NAD(P)H-dependent oxidoreductase [Ralstonia syzygii]|uniref:NAD(P)H-dependent oxidoreductase n=1 Tax=Ralstonia syzygii TaxID=28097 RepID=UPI001BADA260